MRLLDQQQRYLVAGFDIKCIINTLTVSHASEDCRAVEMKAWLATKVRRMAKLRALRELS